MKKIEYNDLPDELRTAIEPHFMQILNALDEWEYKGVEIYGNEKFVAYNLKVEFDGGDEYEE